jgi:hypothetical protein
MKTYDTPDEIVHEKTYLYPHLRYLCIVKAGSCYEQHHPQEQNLKWIASIPAITLDI